MRAAFVLLLLVGIVPAARAQETARAVVERAVAAHGGFEKLSRARADQARMRGVLYVGKASVPFTSEVTVRLPGKYRSAVQLKDGDRTRTLVHDLDGDRVTVSIDDKPQPVQGTHLNQLRQTLEMEGALRLAPLLNPDAFTLTLLGEFTLAERGVIGVGVRGKGQRELKLYFDKETALLVKTEQLVDGENGKDVRQEAYYRDHREAAGHVRAGRAAVYRDGRKVMEAELTDAVRLD